jgi:hypothetical protein
MPNSKKININDKKAWADLDWDDPVVPEALKKTDGKVAVARANRLTKTTKEFKESVTKKNRELAQDPKWLATNKKKNQELAKDPKWLAASKQGSGTRKAKGAELKAKGKEKEFRELFGVRDQHTEETKELMRASAALRWAQTMKKVSALGKIYESIYAAGQALGVHKDTIGYRIKTKPKDYFYVVEKPQKKKK